MAFLLQYWCVDSLEVCRVALLDLSSIAEVRFLNEVHHVLGAWRVVQYERFVLAQLLLHPLVALVAL